MTKPAAIVIGCGGSTFSPEEETLIRRYNPLGLILFRRNCASRSDILSLIDRFRSLVGRQDAPILIDQEGGRVQRLRPPEWADLPAPAQYGRWFTVAPEAAVDAIRRHGRIIGLMLNDVGITVCAAPVLDLSLPGASAVVGDRSFSSDPEIVARLGRAMAEGLMSAGVVPVIKHIPGHGRSLVDSHHELPFVDATIGELEATDLKPFKLMTDMPWAMTGHVVYRAVDPVLPATLSPSVFSEVIRGRIGFDGLVISDDLAMGALTGNPGTRVSACLAAGCDVALYCHPGLSELAEVLEAATPLEKRTEERLSRSGARCRAAMQPGPANGWRDELASLPSAPDRFDALQTTAATTVSTPVAEY
jgi:beta-N-acetylhexosaminidase